METTHNFEFDAGRLCLDFANTLGDRPATQPHEEGLHASADLVAWSVAAGILSGEDAAEYKRAAARDPSTAEAAFARAIDLREAIYRVFSAIVAEAEPLADDLATVNAAIADAMGHARLIPAEGHFHWEWERDPATLGSLLRPVVWSAAELLTAAELHRVHECAGHDCGWLFLDTSKNGSRRWCSMETCGNRAKARRHRERQHAVVP
ncbi:MAG: CGNR zinc finger domain-containing protein [Chloroflexota bacterium]|nr:CGNR zinc finger domain-containing protein [Chloroflexota bacterium]